MKETGIDTVDEIRIAREDVTALLGDLGVDQPPAFAGYGVRGRFALGAEAYGRFNEMVSRLIGCVGVNALDVTRQLTGLEKEQDLNKATGAVLLENPGERHECELLLGAAASWQANEYDDEGLLPLHSAIVTKNREMDADDRTTTIDAAPIELKGMKKYVWGPESSKKQFIIHELVKAGGFSLDRPSEKPHGVILGKYRLRKRRKQLEGEIGNANTTYLYRGDVDGIPATLLTYFVWSNDEEEGPAYNLRCLGTQNMLHGDYDMFADAIDAAVRMHTQDRPNVPIRTWVDFGRSMLHEGMVKAGFLPKWAKFTHTGRGGGREALYKVINERDHPKSNAGPGVDSEIKAQMHVEAIQNRFKTILSSTEGWEAKEHRSEPMNLKSENGLLLKEWFKPTDKDIEATALNYFMDLYSEGRHEELASLVDLIKAEDSLSTLSDEQCAKLKGVAGLYRRDYEFYDDQSALDEIKEGTVDSIIINAALSVMGHKGRSAVTLTDVETSVDEQTFAAVNKDLRLNSRARKLLLGLALRLTGVNPGLSSATGYKTFVAGLEGLHKYHGASNTLNPPPFASMSAGVAKKIIDQTAWPIGSHDFKRSNALLYQDYILGHATHFVLDAVRTEQAVSDGRLFDITASILSREELMSMPTTFLEVLLALAVEGRANVGGLDEPLSRLPIVSPQVSQLLKGRE